MGDFLNSLENMSFSIWVRESSSIWAFPTFLVLHTIGMSIVAGLSAMIDLVLLGLWPKVPVKPLEKLYPLLWAGFWLNLVTGTVLLIADASTKLTNWDFYVKMCFVIAGTWLIFFKIRTVVFGDAELDQKPVSSQAKTLAMASLACWFLAITAGRLLAYLGPVSGLSGITNK
jgi:hypothetical protein